MSQVKTSSAPNAPSVTSSMLVNTAGILGSRVFGLIRDVLSAAYWGSTETLQAAFATAFAIPNTFRSFFAEGAFANAFVPMISQKLKEGKKEEAWALACRTISLQGTILMVICAIVALACPFILQCLPETTAPTVTRRVFQILPLLIPYALFICVAGAFGSILNALRHFAIPSLTPVIFNLVQIVAITGLFLAGMSRHDFASLLWFCSAVLLAGFLQMLVLMLACRKRGFKFHVDTSWKHPDVRQLMLKIAPGLIGAGAQHVNILIDKALAVFLGAAAVGAITYSNRLIFLPVGIFGAAMGIACLPNMARATESEMAKTLDAALRQVLFLALPCTALFAALNSEIIRLLFQRGAFNDESVRECAWALAFYLPGLPAFCAAKVATTTHHGRQDTATPAKISLLCIGINFLLNITLIHFLRQGGLALASSISSWLNVLLLLAIDTRKLPDWNYRRTAQSAMMIAISAAIGGLAAYAVRNLLADILCDPLQQPCFLRLLLLVCLSAATGGIAYLMAATIFKRPELKEFIGGIRRRKK